MVTRRNGPTSAQRGTNIPRCGLIPDSPPRVLDTGGPGTANDEPLRERPRDSTPWRRLRPSRSGDAHPVSRAPPHGVQPSLRTTGLWFGTLPAPRPNRPPLSAARSSRPVVTFLRVRASVTVAARSPRRRRSQAVHTSGCRRIPASAAEPPKPVPCRTLRSPRPSPVLLAASHRQPYGQSYVPPVVGLDRNLTQGELQGGWGRAQQCPRNRGLGLRLGSAASHPDRCQH